MNWKLDPLSKLLSLAYEKFGLHKIGIENCRLRAYNVVNGIMQDTYMGNEAKSFEELKIYPLKTLVLETKFAHEEFYEYDPNKINLKINVWRKGI